MPSPSRKDVILVEDDARLARLMTHCLQHAGFEVELITDGRAAVSLVHREAVPDLMIIDYLMPYADGLKVTRALRGDARWRTVPIICITEVTGEDTMIDGLRLRSDGFMTKPIDPAALVALARQLTGCDHATTRGD